METGVLNEVKGRKNVQEHECLHKGRKDKQKVERREEERFLNMKK